MKDTGASMTRLAQVAQELHKLADGIGAGKVQISGVDLTISDSVTLKVKQKMTGSKVIFDLKIQALIAREDSGGKNKGLKKKKSTKSNQRPYGVKVIKKKYTGLWRVIASGIKKGEQVDRGVVADFLALSQEYGELAPPEWLSLWQEGEALIQQCISSAQAGDFIRANELLHNISKAKKSCHKMYK